MQRNFKIILEILRKAEKGEVKARTNFNNSEFDMEHIKYNFNLLLKSGFLDSTPTSDGNVPEVINLTWKGHDLLDHLKRS